MRPKYIGVIGNRDYIKIKGEKRPFWEFLDRQPDGWLSSLTYKRKDLPDALPFIFDCGAWSYKDKDVPDVTPASACALYQEYAPAGALVIAPDHMLIPGYDLDARRAFNNTSAKKFRALCPPQFFPMATVHGMDLDERRENLQSLIRIGYRYIALGGLAARAAQKRQLIETVETLRNDAPGVYLHVLGLSSPDYFRHWRRIGVNSADGSSHFKQAFTGGAFFTQEGPKLTKHHAARPGEDITAPACNCTACIALRAENVDTRTYGSNEHNMGRAAHNMNQLMRAQAEAMRQAIGLVACCGQKLDHAAPAKDLYQSDLFRKSRQWVETNCDRWFILSAKHGVIHPDTVIKPYDQTLNETSASARQVWMHQVASRLTEFRDERLVVLAGNRYCEWIEGFSVERPMQGLGIGQQLAWLKDQLVPPAAVLTQQDLFK